LGKKFKGDEVGFESGSRVLGVLRFWELAPQNPMVLAFRGSSSQNLRTWNP
jgi:hypothetical protein